MARRCHALGCCQFKFLNRCQETGSRDLAAAIFPSGGDRIVRDSRENVSYTRVS